MNNEQIFELLKLSVSSEIGADKICALLDFSERNANNERKESYFEAMAVAQAELKTVNKSADNPFFKSKYATFDDIADAVRVVYSKHGLSFRFEQISDGPEITVSCVISHKGGHETESSMKGSVPPGKNPIQQIGSVITYLKRYTLGCATGVSTGDVDDDGNAATTEQPQQQAKPQQAAQTAYPQAQFDKVFPIWEGKIRAGDHTPETLLKFLSTKNIILSPPQVQKIHSVK